VFLRYCFNPRARTGHGPVALIAWPLGNSFNPCARTGHDCFEPNICKITGVCESLRGAESNPPRPRKNLEKESSYLPAEVQLIGIAVLTGIQ
jgi:hypothetical protein